MTNLDLREPSEASPLHPRGDNRTNIPYTALNSLEMGSDESLIVDVDNKDLRSRVLSQWRKAAASREGKYIFSISGIILSLVLISISLATSNFLYGAAWSSNALPFSYVDPHDAGFVYIDRPATSRPGEIFRNLRSIGAPLPTNSWCENFFLGASGNTDATNKVFQVPYIVDTAGPIPGLRSNPGHVNSMSTSVEMAYEAENGLTLGSEDNFDPQHRISGEKENVPARLAIVLEWESIHYRTSLTGSKMSAPVVRGSPYTSMEYFNSRPVIVSERLLSANPLVDETSPGGGFYMECGNDGAFGPHVEVQEEIKLQFDTSDMTWLVFVSEPGHYVCSMATPSIPTAPLPPGVVGPATAPTAVFTLKAVHKMTHGMVRVALANNCTMGQNPVYCGAALQPRDQSPYTALLRKHANVYATGKYRHFLSLFFVYFLLLCPL